MINIEHKRDLASTMYLHMGYSLKQISEYLDIPYATVTSWKQRGGWDELPAYKKIIDALDARYRFLISKPDKNDQDLRELKILGREMRMYELSQKKLQNYEQKTSTKDFQPKRKRSGRKQNKVKNYLNPEQVAKLEAAFHGRLFAHQQVWYDNIHHRIRNIMKSRQVGATDYFSHEGLIDGILNGRNKNFLSASRAQALLFRTYIVKFVYRITGVELKGGGGVEPLFISTDDHAYTEFRFLSTNSNSAQGPHGDVIIDEYFWIRDFKKLRRVSSAMATHKHLRLVYISTPSTVNHQAYPFWSGEHFNRGRKKADHINLDISHEALKNGRLCEDGQWRQIVTLDDAIALGFDLADRDQLMAEYPMDEYRNLFMCVFIDDSSSVFKFESLQKCMVDTLEINKGGQRKRWKDFEPTANRPLGNTPVWLGYDPSRTTDAAAIAIVAPPLRPGGKFRIIERIRFSGKSFRIQANMIKKYTEKYNVVKMAMDVTGLGIGVFELIKDGDEVNDPIFSGVKPIHYSADSKKELVMKGVDVIESGRLEFDSGASDLVKAFLTIYRTATDNGTVTYKAKRTAETGHADEAFAVLHCFTFEPLNNKRRKMKVRVSNARKRKQQQKDDYSFPGDSIINNIINHKIINVNFSKRTFYEYQQAA